VRNVGSSFAPQFQLESPSSGIAGLTVVTNRNDAIGPSISLAKSRGGAIGSTTIVANGDALGELRFCGADGTDIETVGARIVANVDGTPGANNLPTRLSFFTTPSGSASPVERMRITSIGEIASLSDHPNGNNLSSSNAASTGFNLITGRHSGTAVGGGTLCFAVRTNGDVVNTNNSYTAISDIKLKENIVDAKSQWDDIKGLRVVNYNFKKETGAETYKQLGLIAQEVEQVCPGLVGETPDRDEDGNDLGTTTKNVNYSILYMKAVGALQEAMERIETLETRLTALEGGAN
jgi:hypothetical protein